MGGFKPKRTRASSVCILVLSCVQDGIGTKGLGGGEISGLGLIQSSGGDEEGWAWVGFCKSRVEAAAKKSADAWA